LETYYESNFALMHHHKWNIEYIENLMPWEKEIYITMLIQFLKEEERKAKERAASSSR